MDVEQLLGRVLRMPYAKRRRAEGLNRAYAFLSEPSFGEAAQSLADKLVAMGFEEDDALDNIEPAQISLDADSGLFGPRDKPRPAFKYTVTATPEVVAELRKREGVTLLETEDGKVEIAVTGRVDGGLEQAIFEALPETERTGFSAAVTKYRVEVKDQLSPAGQGDAFEVMGCHASRSDPQQVPCELRPLRRSHLRFLSPTNATRVENLARHHHRQLQDHIPQGVSGSGVSWVYFEF